jgi:hypothetical protein
MIFALPEVISQPLSLGDEVRADFHVVPPEGKSKSYTFLCPGMPSMATLSLELSNVGQIGAGASVNGTEVVAFLSEPNGRKSVTISPAVLHAGGNNILAVYAKASGGTVEDFEFKDLAVALTTTLN